jgi:uncharacterized membrane protein YqjE
MWLRMLVLEIFIAGFIGLMTMVWAWDFWKRPRWREMHSVRCGLWVCCGGLVDVFFLYFLFFFFWLDE